LPTKQMVLGPWAPPIRQSGRPGSRRQSEKSGIEGTVLYSWLPSACARYCGMVLQVARSKYLCPGCQEAAVGGCQRCDDPRHCRGRVFLFKLRSSFSIETSYQQQVTGPIVHYAPASDKDRRVQILDKLFKAVRAGAALTSGASGSHLPGGYAGSVLQDESDGRTRPQGASTNTARRASPLSTSV
jgi:hypothetical protein